MREEKNKEIILNGVAVAYCLKTSARARNLRISVRAGGAVAAVKPRFISEKFVEDFLVKKADWILEKIGELKNRQGLTLGGNRVDFKNRAKEARVLVLEKIARINQIYKLPYGRLAIRNQRTRWGSCSRRGNLNFNYKIVLLPDRLSDYIVAHELCHLKELNHSRRFWDLVGAAIPDYAARRKELKNFS